MLAANTPPNLYELVSMTVISWTTVIVSVLVVFLGIYLREAVRHAQKQKRIASRATAYYHAICGEIAAIARNSHMLPILRLLDGNIEAILKQINQNFISSVASHIELHNLSSAIHSAVILLANAPADSEHPLMPYALEFSNSISKMDPAEYNEVWDTMKALHYRYIFDPDLLSDKEGAVISTKLAISISQIRNLQISFIQQTMVLAKRARYHGNDTSMHQNTVSELIALLFICSSIVRNAANMLPEVEHLLGKSTVRVTLENLRL